MSAVPPDRPQTNPSRLPAGLVGGSPEIRPIPDAEIVRRSYLAHESRVRSLGLLGNLLAVLALASALLLANELFGRPPLTFRLLTGEWSSTVTGVLVAWLVALAVVAWGLGVGLRRLAPWARWATVVVAGASSLSYLAHYVPAFGSDTAFIGQAGQQLLINTLGLIASGYVLLVLLARGSARVFGTEYRAVVRQTPEIRPSVSLAAKAVIGIALTLFIAVLATLGVAKIRAL